MDIDKLTRNYIIQCIVLVCILNLLVQIAGNAWHFTVYPATLVGMLFVLVLEIGSVLVWRWVVRKHRDMLPSFFTGASGFRFLGALAIFFIWYLVSESGNMMTFFCVFLIYYFLSLIHHSVFFSRVSNRL